MIYIIEDFHLCKSKRKISIKTVRNMIIWVIFGEAESQSGGLKYFIIKWNYHIQKYDYTTRHYQPIYFLSFRLNDCVST
jgi:hypothetical protein